MILESKILNSRSKSIQSYFNEVSKIPTLTAEEEYEVAIRTQEGDEKARQRLIEANLRFVISVAKQFQHAGVKTEDLIEEGNLGLVLAADRFDPTKGFKFISFAIHYIRRYIVEFLKDTDNMFDIPKSRIQNVNLLKRVMDNLKVKLGREVYVTDLYGNVEGMTNEQIDENYTLIVLRTVSTNMTYGDDEFTLQDILPSNSYKTIVEKEHIDDLTYKLGNMIDVLPTQFRVLMEEVYGINGALKIGLDGYSERHNITRTRAKQLHDVAMRNLKSMAAGTYKAPVELSAKEQRDAILEKYKKTSVVAEIVKDGVKETKIVDQKDIVNVCNESDSVRLSWSLKAFAKKLWGN